MLYEARLNRVIFTPGAHTRGCQEDKEVEEKSCRNRVKRQTREGPNFTALSEATQPYARESSKLP